jgi:hypothetical protein
MLSILIPIYNYNISRLVKEIHKQSSKLNIEFEIICFDDNSTIFLNENELTIAALTNCTIIKSTKKLDRIQARQKLSDTTNYNWLLFLDADTIPKSENFIEIYLSKLASGYEAIYGGFAYSEESPNKESILRWKYGKKYEEVDAKKRNLKPYQIIISANFLIEKAVFDKINSKIEINSYGLDNYFASLLKQNKIKVLHINNEAYHFGIENSKIYLNKIKESINALLWAYHNKKMPVHDNKLLSLFISFKNLKLNYLSNWFYNTFSYKIEKNLLSANPNLLLLQVYKLFYICYKDLKN